MIKIAPLAHNGPILVQDWKKRTTSYRGDNLIIIIIIKTILDTYERYISLFGDDFDRDNSSVVN